MHCRPGNPPLSTDPTSTQRRHRNGRSSPLLPLAPTAHGGAVLPLVDFLVGVYGNRRLKQYLKP